MTQDEIVAAVQEFKDRQAIWDALCAYTRGQDRLDPDSVAKAYHPDALDDHGTFVGPASLFQKWGQSIHRTLHNATTHAMTNHQCEIDGDTAHCETYWDYTQVTKEGELSRRTGRYIDRMEKRNGQWKIAARICVVDCEAPDINDAGDVGVGDVFYPSGRGDKSDPSYMRPLVIDTKRFKTPPPLDGK